MNLERPGAEAARGEAPPKRPLWVRILREPLLHFFLIGLVLFAAGQAWRTAHDQRRIVVTAERVAELAQKYRLQFGADPSPAELERALADYVREEALFREGKAMGLDRDDEIVRRRIAQKVTFLQQDRALPRPPTDATLEAWFKAHAAVYATPVRTSFTHLYFSPDRPGDPQARAARALAAPRTGATPDTVDADPFPDQSGFVRLARDEAKRLFGDSDLAQRLDTAPVGVWSGPYRSGYGWHLVRVDTREAAGRPAFVAVKDRVREDYMADAQETANTAAIAKLVGRYTIVVERPK